VGGPDRVDPSPHGPLQCSTTALDELLGGIRNARSVARLATRFFSPVVLRRPGVEVLRNVRYGEHSRNRLDIHRPADHRTGCPVLVQVHGGAWVIGNSHQQGQPLMRKMASDGWVCVAINYRLSPKATFPDHIVDVKRSLAWVREHIHEYGGDPSTLVITGGSAGGHLAALAALTPNDPRFQPGFEDADTSVSACIPFYGVYDLCDRNNHRDGAYEDLLGRVVFKTRWTTIGTELGPGLPDQPRPGRRPTVLRHPGSERHAGVPRGGAGLRRGPPVRVAGAGGLRGDPPRPARVRRAGHAPFADDGGGRRTGGRMGAEREVAAG
jgi:acetyl esterase/lipase